MEEEDDAFSGEANPSLVTQVITNYINSNSKAPTFKDFTSIYYDYELAKKAAFRKVDTQTLRHFAKRCDRAEERCFAESFLHNPIQRMFEGRVQKSIEI